MNIAMVKADAIVAEGFKSAVARTSEIEGAYCEGLQAFEPSDKKAVVIKDNRKLNGSVNLDRELRSRYPDSSRWDYALGYDGKVCFVEVHPASTKNIDEMVKKKEWLVWWLKNKAPFLDAMPALSPKFCWAATGSGIHISTQASYKRKLAQLGLRPQHPVIIGDR